MTDTVGQKIINNIVNSIFPVEDVKADDVTVSLKEDNYHYQLNVHGAAEGQRVTVEVNPLTAGVDTEVQVTALESNRRFNFLITVPGLYEISVKVLDENGAEVSGTTLYRTLSYSEEYDMFTEREPLGQALLEIIATDGKGAVISDPAEAYVGFSDTLLVVIDPRVLFLILSIALVLLDIAVRKFKFKWPHELIREYKAKKADEEAAQG